MEYGIGAAVGLVLGLMVGLALKASSLTSRFGGKDKFELGLKVAQKAGTDPNFATGLDKLFNPPPPPPPSGEAIRLLGLLQRDARLLDFLMENLQPYSDDQIGASVRDIHRKAQGILKKHLVLEPVLAQSEGETVTVAKGFDPSAIRVVGNVTGEPPFRGTLQHSGWRVKSFDLPKPTESVDEFVIMPAEVELS